MNTSCEYNVPFLNREVGGPFQSINSNIVIPKDIRSSIRTYFRQVSNIVAFLFYSLR